jgi:hypothetical protein
MAAYTEPMDLPDTSWEARTASLWNEFDALDDVEFLARIESLATELPPDSAIGRFERGAAQDSTGHPEAAVALYRAALGSGLSGLRRRRGPQYAGELAAKPWRRPTGRRPAGRRTRRGKTRTGRRGPRLPGPGACRFGPRARGARAQPRSARAVSAPLRPCAGPLSMPRSRAPADPPIGRNTRAAEALRGRLGGDSCAVTLAPKARDGG